MVFLNGVNFALGIFASALNDYFLLVLITRWWSGG